MKRKSHITRFADLDTQRHVTSRTYELIALEHRHEWLANHGYDVARLYDEHILHLPATTTVRFQKQQYAGAKLLAVNKVNELAPGKFFWDQQIQQTNGANVCHIQSLTQLLNKQHEAISIPLKKTELKKISAEPGIESPVFQTLVPFSGKCQEMIFPVEVLYSDRDTFGLYNMNTFWKIFEDGRWRFSAALGLTFEKIKEHDTTSFYMGGISHAYNQPVAGETLTLHVRISRMEKIRYFFRQDLMRDNTRIASMEDEQLVVSLSRARPQRITEHFRDLLLPYTEQLEQNK